MNRQPLDSPIGNEPERSAWLEHVRDELHEVDRLLQEAPSVPHDLLALQTLRRAFASSAQALNALAPCRLA